MKRIELWENKDTPSDKVTFVDDEDYEKVMSALGPRSKKWYAHCSPGATHYATTGTRLVAMHRVVMDAPKGMDVDLPKQLKFGCFQPKVININLPKQLKFSCLQLNLKHFGVFQRV